MNLTTVDSSMLYAIGYDDEACELHAVFRSGKTFVYRAVPREVYDALMASPSKGQFMRHSVIGEYDEALLSRRRR